MNILRITTIALALTLLVACGGGGSSNTATAPTPPTSLTPPIENPFADLANFMPTTDSSLQVIEGIVGADGARINTSSVFEEGNLNEEAAGCNVNGCVVPLPGGVAPLPSDIVDIPYLNIRVGDISLISNGHFFSTSTYSSEITNGMTVEGIEGITFARGKLTGTRVVDSETLEFESFAGWLDGNIFGVTQITIGASGSEQYRFISYGAGSYDADTAINPTATGTETTSATWEGATVATIKASRDFIFGDATITVNFTDTNVDLEFDNWHDLDNQELSTMEPIIYEGAGLGQGRFSLRRNNITEVFGRFYGTGHTEVGGWFNTPTVTGAFGGTRQ